jgi:hypothetical protein
MTNFEFYDGLRNHPFTSNNGYSYNGLTESSLRFFKDCPNYPFIMQNPYQRDPTVLTYSPYTYQLRGRLLNTARIKEVMDTAPIPLTFKIRDKFYLIGKGFLAHVANVNDIGENFNMLFVACIEQGRVIEKMEDVRFFVNRDIYKEDFKTVHPAVKDIFLGHPGDVIMTNNIAARIGDKIPFPRGGTIAQRQNYKKAVMLEAMGDYFV